MTPDPHDLPAPPGERGTARMQRLSELRNELYRGRIERRAYACNALLELLWVEDGQRRLCVLRALCDQTPETGKSENPPLIGRLAARLQRSAPAEDLPPPPTAPQLLEWIGQALAAVLTESLDRLKAAMRAPEPPLALAQQEAEVCQQSLFLARLLAAEATAEVGVRVLRMLPAALSRTSPLPPRQMGVLREAACALLGALSPDALFSLWSYLGGPDAAVRQDLLPALDYLRDARAVPYLIRLSERRSQWIDGEIVGWFLVRAFERIGDRAALPALRRIAVRIQAAPSPLPALRSLEGVEAGTSPELAREAQRVLQLIEQGKEKKEKKERNFLLRPAPQPTHDLLLPAAESPFPTEEHERQTLLRPDDPSPK